MFTFLGFPVDQCFSGNRAVGDNRSSYAYRVVALLRAILTESEENIEPQDGYLQSLFRLVRFQELTISGIADSLSFWTKGRVLSWLLDDLECDLYAVYRRIQNSDLAVASDLLCLISTRKILRRRAEIGAYVLHQRNGFVGSRLFVPMPHRQDNALHAAIGRRIANSYYESGLSDYGAAVQAADEAGWADHPEYGHDIRELETVPEDHAPSDYVYLGGIVYDEWDDWAYIETGAVVHEDSISTCEDCCERFHEDLINEHGVCDSCEDNYYRCERCGCRLHSDRTFYTEGDDGPYCEDCYPEVESDEEPEFFHNSSSPGSSRVDRWVRDLHATFPDLGCSIPAVRFSPEIELSECETGIEDDYESCGWEGKEDGTSGVVIEIVPIHRMIGDRGLARYKALLDELANNYGADSDNRCGGHVHLDISMYPPDERNEVIKRMHRRWSLVESLLYQETFDYGYAIRSVFGRGLYEHSTSVVDLHRHDVLSDVTCRGGGRYSALNVTNYPTIEVRASNQMLGDKAIAYAYFLMRLLHDNIQLSKSIAPHRRMAKWLLSLPASILEALNITPRKVEEYVVQRFAYTLDKHGPELPLAVAGKKHPESTELATCNTEMV